MIKKDVGIDKVKELWANVKKHITTENGKLIDAINALDRYLY